MTTTEAMVERATTTEVSEEELCKVLVKIWGYKWVEFEDIPLPGAEGRDRIADAYSIRLNAQDAVRGLLRRYIIQPRAAALSAALSSPPGEGDVLDPATIEACAKVSDEKGFAVADTNADRYWQSVRISRAIRALSASSGETKP